MTWLAENIVFVGFVLPEITLEPMDTFRKVFGQDADRLNPEPGPGQGQRASKKLEPYNLSVISRVGRIDVLIESSVGDPPLIEDVKNAVEQYGSKFLSYLEQQDFIRLSAIAHMAKKLESSDAARAAFSAETGIKTNEDMSELVYRYNQVKTFDDFTINRLTTFEMTEMQVIEFKVGTASPNPIVQSKIDLLKQLLDFNSVPDGNLMAKDMSKAVFEKLLSEIKERI